MAAASAISCGLPAASFDAIRSGAEIKNAVRPLAGSITPSTRRSHAASKSTLKCCSEFGEGSIGRLRVYRVCLNENVHVPRKARLRVKDDSITSDDEVLNAMGMEGGQKVFVVLVHPVPSPSL